MVNVGSWRFAQHDKIVKGIVNLSGSGADPSGGATHKHSADKPDFCGATIFACPLGSFRAIVCFRKKQCSPNPP